jgi:hypothetical protein
MEWAEILRTFGPQAIPWIALAYVGKWLMGRMDADLDTRVKLALALEGLTNAIKENRR